MSRFSQMMNDRVALAKKNGERHEDIPALVDSKMIFLEDVTLPIEEGDRFERKLPNGIVESYLVLDPGFKKGVGGMPSHYQTQVRRASEGNESIETEPNGDPAVDIFISHSSSDLEFAKRLLTLLRSALRLPAASIRCTSVDGHRLPGGADTDEQLRREVHGATAFIGIISAASLSSMYVAFELGARWGAERHLLPILTPGADASILSGPLAGVNALRSDNASQVHQMIDEVANLLGVEPERAQVFQAEIDALLSVPASPAPSDKIVSDELDDVEVTILEMLSKLPTTASLEASSIASHLGLPEQRTEFHLRRLVVDDFVADRLRMGEPAEYFIAQKGRGVLFERGRL